MSGFDRIKNKIIVVHYGNLMLYPPVISLLENLLNNNFNVILISGNTEKLPKIIREHTKIKIINIDLIESNNIFMRLKRRIAIGLHYRRKLAEFTKKDDIVWTTTDSTVRVLNKVLLKYKHIMQLMELDEYYPLFDSAKFLKFDLSKYSRMAWKTVVPEINRAYIQKVKWRLVNVPSVLPNKPYYLDPGDITSDVQKGITIIEKEKRKIIMYMGVIGTDRNLLPFIDAIEELGGDYCFYILGSISDRDSFNYLIKEHRQVRYLGFFNPPGHLHFLKYAYIGVLPYETNISCTYISPLNVLYCAPNKIYEYAGYGIPMIGTDVLGLKIPFEKYNMGVCCSDLKKETIIRNIRYIEENHSKMRKKCFDFYRDTDLNSIVQSIILDSKE